MRRLTVLAMAVGLLIGVLAAPAAAKTTNLAGPNPAIWLSDPDGIDGDNGIEQGDDVEDSSGTATVNNNGATVKVKATGLEPGHTYTMWVVFFNDQTECAPDGLPGDCNGEDLDGITYGDGKVVGGSGKATFSARLNDGDVGSLVPGTYETGEDNEFHVVIRSHGPKIPGQVAEQTHTLGGGCTVEVGPEPEEIVDLPVPQAEGECGDVQLYIFS